MPTDKEILGFGNEWYQPALENAFQVCLPSGKNISLSVDYFIGDGAT